jgi:N-acetylneuraminic acid mutarotase
MKLILFSLTLLLSLPAVSQAHFIWLLTGAGEDAGRVQVFFGEAAKPDDPELLDLIARSQAWSVGKWGKPEKLPLTKGEEALEGTLSEKSRQNAVVLNHTYGVITRGDSSFLLNYYAKSYPYALPGTWHAIEDERRLPLEIVPTREGNDTVLHLAWNGKSSAGSEIVIVGPGIKDKLEGTTDEAGNFRCELPASGVYSIRGKVTEDKAGTHDGKEYGSTRHYTTLTLRNVPSKFQSAKHKLPELPQGITSFGGAIAGDTFYAYGGNYGSAHEYSNEEQSNDLWALNLADGSEWKKVSTGPRLQGLAMVAHDGLLYRIGGFTAMNKEGEDQNLQSQSTVAQFNPKTGIWKELPPLPEARSSHDAAILGDSLYVAGGWNMPRAGEDRVWHKTAWTLDLSKDDAQWKSIAAPPFQRRALSLAAWNSKLFCIGGMKMKGGPTTVANIYDPATNSWSDAPALLGTSMDGFGSSAFACNGALFVSTISGSLQRLSADTKSWEFVSQFDHPRFFHRMLPWENSSLVSVGGGNMMTGKVTEVDLVKIKSSVD